MLAFKLPNDIVIVNVTPHPITFWKEGWESTVVVPPSGTVISARVSERVVREEGGVTFVTPTFEADEAGLKALDEIERSTPGALVVGSLIAAQAYPGRVVAMVSAPGYERVPPAEKRMRPDRFTVFG